MKPIFLKHFIIISIFITSSVFSQSKDYVKISVDNNFDIIKTAQEYFGKKDYWTYILKVNRLSGVEQIKPGMTLLIPVEKVKSTFALIEKAKLSLSEAINIGGKILAEELVVESENSFSNALRQADNFNFESSLGFANESILYSKRAYKKTKEIRDKTVDAIVSYKKGTLQKRKYSALSWIPIELYENLHEKDLARTLSKSNAQITFYDLSQIRLNENSQAAIQSTRFDPLTKKSNSKIKIEKGDAYALLQSSPKKNFGIEIPGVKTNINSKYFWIEKGNSDTKLANYDGEIKLQANNQSVIVQKNQGSVIPDGGTPTVPVNLLQPPKLLSPSDQLLIKDYSVNFKWSNNKIASSYWLEISKDANFKSVINLTKNILSSNKNITLDGVGVFYWHVCSVDNKGLPGPFSETFSFAVSNDKSKPFIMLRNLSPNIFTQDSCYKIIGKISLSSELKINHDLVTVDSAGNFQHIISLSEGKNILNLTATDSAGNNYKITKNIFYEKLSQVKLFDSRTNKEISSLDIFSNIINHKMELSTIPFATIMLRRNDVDSPINMSSDSTGFFTFSLELDKNISKYELLVTSQTGLKRNYSFVVIFDNDPPVIELNTTETAVNSSPVMISGRTDANLLYINEKIIDISNDNSFTSYFDLESGDNIFEIKAIDKAGNQTLKIEKIIYDNLPPILLDYKFSSAKNKSGNSVLLIKAFDQTQLKKFAVVNYSIESKFFTNYARLDESNGWYQFEFNSNSGIKFISVELQDYFENKKLYELMQ